MSVGKLCVVALAVTTGVACASDGPLAPTPSRVAGVWHRAGLVPGSSEEWNLALADTAITGSGTWQFEAGPGGSLTIRGFTARDSIHLDLNYTYQNAFPGGPQFLFLPSTAHFDGVLAGSNAMHGTSVTLYVGPKALADTETIEMQKVR